eukprot:CAMPEP_0171813472 /NCGR_PEP_ID=MMETSP0991-20121206/79232_1 /TAXON_ID=483369 /ORGANISM="non described non described, Strain CCMP2098" /LENGTH=45 /DNA_ID= /DNA_START= /DNA_END= /DNA_ORIENTATION=
MNPGLATISNRAPNRLAQAQCVHTTTWSEPLEARHAGSLFKASAT